MMKRFCALYLALISCGKLPTEPEYSGPCTMSTDISGMKINYCYTICPPGAEKYASVSQQTFSKENKCAATVTP